MLEYNNEKDKSIPSPMCLPQDLERKPGWPSLEGNRAPLLKGREDLNDKEVRQTVIVNILSCIPSIAASVICTKCPTVSH